MNLKLSYNWLKEYLKTEKSVFEVAKELSLKGQSVDRVNEVKPAFKGVITAKILDIQKHPNADKLRLATVNAGKFKSTVVCGAPNINVGQVVPLAVEGAEVSDPQGNPFVIKKAKIRDVESNGMLCSQKELGIGQDHTGIMILPSDTPLGKPLEKVLDLNDYILEVEVTSNRPDAMSVVGLAREASACLGVKLNWKMPKPDLKVVKKLPLSVEVKEPKLCPKYLGIVITDVKVSPSPLWLQTRLLASGLRPINNLADITNYILLEYGRPMHVFDYDKLNGQKIIVRKAKAGESILALDGKIYQLKPQHLVIADEKAPVAIAGVMGGELSGATEMTKTIVFESATFDPVLIRKTARELNLHSESSDLFEKNLHPETTIAGMLKAIELVQKLAGGKVASVVFDSNKNKFQPNKIKFDTNGVKRHLGIEIPISMIKNILDSLGFTVSGSKTLSVTVPWWRQNDVVYDYDLIEEIARIYGYHNLPVNLPQGEIPQEKKDLTFFWENLIKNSLAGLGFTEVLNYSMISANLLEKTKFKPSEALKIHNPLNEELEYLRPTLLSGILQNVSENLNNFSEIKIFELSNVYLKNKETELPAEVSKVTGAVVWENEIYLEAKGIVEFLLKKLGISGYNLKATDSACPLWEAGQCLDILKEGKFLGQFGIIKNDILEKFGIKKPVGIFDFEISSLMNFATTVKSFLPIPEFPSIVRDLAIVVDDKISWGQVSDSVNQADQLIAGIEYLSTFTDSSLGGNKKSLAFRIVFRAKDRTLKSEEVDEVIKKVVQKLQSSFGAKLR